MWPFRKARLAPRDPAAEPSPGWSFLRGSNTAVITYDKVIAADAALRHPVASRCIQKIAEAVEGVAWYARRDPNVIEADRASKSDVAELNRVLASPNDSFPPDVLRYWLALTFACYGRVPFVVGLGSAGLPNAIYPLDAAMTQGDLNERGTITAYTYGSVGQSRSKYPARRFAPAGKPYAYEIARPGLSGRFEGNRPNALSSIGLPGEISSLLLSRAVDTAAGHPNIKYVISSEKPLTLQQQTALREHIDNARAGGDESGNVLILHGTTVTVSALDNGLSDIHSKVPLDDMARLIAGAFGVPVPLLGLGAADAAKYAGNYEAARRAFYEDTVIPGYLTPIASGLTAALCPPGAEIAFDLDSIEALADARITRGKDLATVDCLTDDEKRSLMGFEPLTEEQKAEIAANRATKTTQTPTAPTASN